MKYSRGFASDNNSGVHPEIFEAMSACNKGHTIGYGDDGNFLNAVFFVERELVL